MRWLAAIVLAACAAPATTSAPECAVDGDCALIPQVSCCGECPPIPPFDVGTRENLDAVLIESEARCAHDTRPCAPLVCEPSPAGCWARAACSDGKCTVVSEGCTIQP